MQIRQATCILAGMLAAGMLPAANVTVYGDGTAFTNAGGANAGNFAGFDAWFSANVRNGGASGITSDYPRSGNGSAYLAAPAHAGNNSKADFEYLFGNGGYTLGTLSAFSYDWYRDSASTVAGHLMPAIRLYFDADGSAATTTDRGYLVFERAYNPDTAAVPVDQWVSDDVYNFAGAGQSANLWMVNFANPNGSVLEIFNRDLQDWLTTPNPNANYPTLSSNTIIYGLSVGVGSGWTGAFEGGVDNVRLAFGTSFDTTWNFEVQGGDVPEPATGVLLLGGLGLMAAMRRRC